jgi:hypothetical protein
MARTYQFELSPTTSSSRAVKTESINTGTLLHIMSLSTAYYKGIAFGVTIVTIGNVQTMLDQVQHTCQARTDETPETIGRPFQTMPTHLLAGAVVS